MKIEFLWQLRRQAMKEMNRCAGITCHNGEAVHVVKRYRLNDSIAACCTFPFTKTWHCDCSPESLSD